MAYRRKGLSKEEIEKLMQELDEEPIADSDSDCKIDNNQSFVSENDAVNVPSEINWRVPKFDEEPNILPFTGRVGIKPNIQPDDNELSFFQLFFSDEIFKILADETNRYAQQILEIRLESTERRKHYPPWSPTNDTELKKFLGLVMLMSHIDKDSITDYWSKDDVIETPIFGKTMSRDRFLKILKYLHFEDNKSKPSLTSYDILWKVRKIFECLNSSFKNVYEPTEHLAIDEIIVKFKGRVIFRQYIPKKHKRWGIKVYKIADENGYTYNMSVYIGKDSSDDDHLPASHQVVRRLTNCISYKGHKLFMDNFFSSPELYRELLDEKMINCCGTNRKTF